MKMEQMVWGLLTACLLGISIMGCKRGGEATLLATFPGNSEYYNCVYYLETREPVAKDSMAALIGRFEAAHASTYTQKFYYLYHGGARYAIVHHNLDPAGSGKPWTLLQYDAEDERMGDVQNVARFRETFLKDKPELAALDVKGVWFGHTSNGYDYFMIAEDQAGVMTGHLFWNNAYKSHSLLDTLAAQGSKRFTSEEQVTTGTIGNPRYAPNVQEFRDQ